MPVSQVYLISEQYPATNKLRKGFDVATAELRRHVELLRLFMFCCHACLSCSFCHYHSHSGIADIVSTINSIYCWLNWIGIIEICCMLCCYICLLSLQRTIWILYICSPTNTLHVAAQQIWSVFWEFWSSSLFVIIQTFSTPKDAIGYGAFIILCCSCK